MESPKAIKVLITGGTIDGLEYSTTKDAPEKPKTLIPELLKVAGLLCLSPLKFL